MPTCSFKSNARPSLFAYPPEVKPPTTATPQKAPTAILSTTKKVKARAQKLASEKAAEKGKLTTSSTDVVAMDIEKKEVADKKPEKGKKEEKEKEKKDEKEKEPEPLFEIKQNPARVTLPQVKHITFDVDTRYTPVKKGDVFGIVVLKDNTPGEPENLITLATASTSTPIVDEKEPEPPKPFLYP
jgi:26S proteasome regulatory subunit N2